MPATDLWTFGLNHLLTIIGFFITFSLAAAGLQSFAKWKRERIEERRIDIALEALALAYEAEFIFNSIRNPLSFEYEWAEMQDISNSQKRQAAGPYFAVIKRIEAHKNYFQRLRMMQPRFMAAFGKDTADIFEELWNARTNIELAARSLMNNAIDGALNNTQDRDKRDRNIVRKREDQDPISPLLKKFIDGVEEHCNPVVSNRFSRR